MLRTLRGLRNDLGLTQKELADKIECPIASYQRYERYETEVPMTVLMKISKLCGDIDLREIRFK